MIRENFIMPSLSELFVMECKEKIDVLSERLIDLEGEGHLDKYADEILRAAHSIKGAARIVEQSTVVKISHLIEDYFVALIKDKNKPTPSHIDTLLNACDYILRIAEQGSNSQEWVNKHSEALQKIINSLQTLPHTLSFSDVVTDEVASDPWICPADNSTTQEKVKISHATVAQKNTDRHSRLVGLIEEALIDLRWIEPFSRSLHRLQRQQWDLTRLMHKIREAFAEMNFPEKLNVLMDDLETQTELCRENLIERLSIIDSHTHQWVNTSGQLQKELIQARMRPFNDCVREFPRLARDVARTLGKQVRIEVKGRDTLVDRDVMSRIENPLLHLLYNAIDHGIEIPKTREKNEKSPVGTLKISAYHQGGMLCITVADDGGGINIEALRKKVVLKGLVSQYVADILSHDELIDFIFLPQFSTKEFVTDISGRGVGLDIVRDVAQDLRGSVRALSNSTQGAEFQLKLPLTLSVVRVLLIDVSSEIYAIPLARIGGVSEIYKNLIVHNVEGDFVELDNVSFNLIAAAKVLGLPSQKAKNDLVKIVKFTDSETNYGLIVDGFKGEHDLVLQPLPSQLGKVKDISAAAISNEGLPILVVDVDDLLLSIKQLQKSKNNNQLVATVPSKIGKRILVADDSITVREMQRELLEGRGFSVETVVDGMEAWNAIRNNHYDIVITDLDMPRITGLELIKMIKKDQVLEKLPVIVISYKDRDEDRNRVIEAGADYFFSKGSRYADELFDVIRKITNSDPR